MPTTTKTTRRIFAPGRAPAAATVVTTAPGRGGNPTLSPPPPTSQCCCPACVGLECLDRTRFFSGQLLTEADLNNEQSYWLAKSRLHNRFLHGWGVVCGMQVVCSDCDGWVTIKSGYAIDPCGNDIIVCADYPFNVVKAIQACCTPTQQTSNCAPLRSIPSENCVDPQHWCILIEYQEQPSRLVTPLKKATPKSSTCSCSSTKGGCGCGCGGHGTNGSSASSSNGCSCASTATQSPSVPAGACEPTRINEGYRVCVVPELTNQISGGSLPGTTGYQIDQGIQELTKLLLLAPQLDPNKLNPITDPQLAYTAVFNYRATLSNYFSSPSVTNCSILDGLNQIKVPSPPQDTTNYIAQQLVPVATQLSGVVVNSAMQRYCLPLLMPCPPDPCDDRLCVACVTVQNGKITDICNFGCRHQVFTFQTLYAWLSAFGLDAILLRWKSRIEIGCCTESGLRGNLFSSSTFQRQNLTSAGLTNPGMANQLLSAFVAQKLGATFVNSALPPNFQAQTVDLRPLVGLDTETALRTLGTYNINLQNLTTTAVDSDPMWNDDAVAAGPQFTPAAFLPVDPLTTNANHLTMYTKGKLVVGFDMTDPVSVLKSQVLKLQQQVDNLSGAAGTPGGGGAAATPVAGGGGTTPGKHAGSSPASEHHTGRGPTKKKN